MEWQDEYKDCIKNDDMHQIHKNYALEYPNNDENERVNGLISRT